MVVAGMKSMTFFSKARLLAPPAAKATRPRLFEPLGSQLWLLHATSRAVTGNVPARRRLVLSILEHSCNLLDRFQQSARRVTSPGNVRGFVTQNDVTFPMAHRKRTVNAKTLPPAT